MSALIACLAAMMSSVCSSAAVAPPDEAAPERYDGHSVVRVEIRSLRDARIMNALSDDPWTCRWDGVSPGLVDFCVTPDALAALRETDLEFHVLIDDLQKRIELERVAIADSAARRGEVGLRGPGGSGLGTAWFEAFKPIADVSAAVNTLAAARPDLASRVPVGMSVLNAEIFAIRITSGVGGGSGTKPAIVITGCQHAREWITVMSTMWLADTLVSRYDSDPRVRRLVDAFEWYIIPVVNPDGYDYSWTTRRTWRKNRRDNGGGEFGVDLNRNWGAAWNTVGSSPDPSTDTYHGPTEFSEPETRAVRDFVLARTNVLMHFDIHSYSQLILLPRGYDWSLPPDAATYRTIADRMQSAMFAVEGLTYSAGEVFRNIYPVGGGINDWVYGPAGAGPLSIGFELRDLGQNGFLLPAAEIVPGSRELADGVFAGAEWMLDRRLAVEFVESGGAPERVHAQGATTLDVRVLRARSRVDLAAAPVLRQRIGRTGPFQSSAMVLAGSDELGAVWRGALSAGPCGSVVQYDFELRASDGAVVQVPGAFGGGVVPISGAIGSATFAFESEAQQFDEVLVERFDSLGPPGGWLTAEPDPSRPDTAAANTRWTHGDPNGTIAQTEFDRSPLSGNTCFFTGVNTRGNPGTGDVDGGKTTLVSQPIDLSGYADGEISFWLWFSNNRGSVNTDDDALVVDVVSEPVLGAGGAGLESPPWVRALTLRSEAPISQATGVWRRYAVRVGEFVAPSAHVRVRVIATDASPGSYVEAAIDDVQVIGLVCARSSCAGDWNGDGAASVQDVFDFLMGYFANEARADFDASGAIGVQDIFEFLAAYFAGCV